MKIKVKMYKFFPFVLAFLLLTSHQTNAETYKTNIDGVVLKNVRCGTFKDTVFFNISNRTANVVSGSLFVTAFDSDGDPIDTGKTFFQLGPVTGKKTSIVVTCDENIKRLAFKIK